MTDLARFGLVLIGLPITVAAAGIALGLIGKAVTKR